MTDSIVGAATSSDSIVGGAAGTDAISPHSYYENMLSLFGTSIITYLRLNETSGATAADSSGNGRTGTYSGVLLANSAGPDNILCPYFDGTNDYVDFYGASYNTAFNPLEGTLIIWAKVSDVAEWTDGLYRNAISIMDGSAKRIAAAKHSTDNKCEMVYNTSLANITGRSDITWVLFAVTWSQTANENRYYINGVQYGTTAAFPVQLGALFASGSCIGIRRKDLLTEPWKGWLSNAIILDRPATNIEIATVYNDAITATSGQSNYAVVISFDDGGDNIYDEGYLYMESIGLHKATMYVISNTVGNAGVCSWAELQTMYASGWDIGNHTKTHPNLTTLTQAQIETELTDCKTALDAHGLTRASNQVAYPGGLRDADSDAAMTATGMKSGRLITGGAFDYTTLADKRQMSTWDISLGQATKLEWVEAQILSAKISLNTIIIYGHSLVAVPAADTEWSIANFQALMDWIKLNNINLVTISELSTMAGW